MRTAAAIARSEPAPAAAVPVGLKVPAADERAAIWDQPLATTTPHPAFWLIAAHGGAGATTLAHLWAPAADAQRGWPAADRYPSVVVLARTHRTGLNAAHVLLRQAAAGLIGGCTLLGLVTVADHDGSLPTSLRRQRDLVEELAPNAWRIPFLPPLRLLTPDQLPQWSPRDKPPPDAKRFARKPDPTELVPTEIADVGTEIFTLARTTATNI